MAKSLKADNSKWLVSFTTINVLIILAIFSGHAFDPEWLSNTWENLTTKGGVPLVAIPIVTVILSNFVSSRWKATLIFWRIKYPLPGCRVFSKLAAKDPRINLKKLRGLSGGRFPRAPSKQNELWYRIYKKHKDVPAVVDAHRSFLLTRDIATMSFLLAVGVGVFVLLFPELPDGFWVYLLSLVIFYFFATVASKNYGRRFTLNVLAEESAEIPE